MQKSPATPNFHNSINRKLLTHSDRNKLQVAGSFASIGVEVVRQGAWQVGTLEHRGR